MDPKLSFFLIVLVVFGGPENAHGGGDIQLDESQVEYDYAENIDGTRHTRGNIMNQDAKSDDIHIAAISPEVAIKYNQKYFGELVHPAVGNVDDAGQKQVNLRVRELRSAASIPTAAISPEVAINYAKKKNFEELVQPVVG